MVQRVHDKLVLALMIITVLTIISVGISINREIDRLKTQTKELSCKK